MKRLLFYILIFINLSASAQEYKVFGKITNTRMEPLAFATVQVKNTRNSVITKENGSYSLNLPNGIHELVVTMIGYEPLTLEIIINKSSVVQNIILEENDRNLAGVTVKSLVKDRAEEFIRQVIKHKEEIQNAAGAYSCNVYIKAVQEDSTLRISKNKTKQNKDSLNKDLQQMAMAEIMLKMDYENGKLKEERIGITKRGNV
ncbi:MAG TPA: carboxypeptidase-like regulatory domain-containing protein, partial [Niabella sp.]|nr:carboxypeptidase-like regulatory domain-containing protein [Niabella sp.]